jgi:nicotinate-nucleotide adenylyltransferase
MFQRKIGILGGTFDPVHVGHLIVAQTTREIFELNCVMFIPCATPPHKCAKDLCNANHRLAMIQMATEWNTEFEVSDIEIQRSGKSYAIDTVKILNSEHPDAEIYFIIGSDTLKQLHTWRNIYDLLPLCRFITFARTGHDDMSPEGLNLDDPWPRRLLDDVIVGRHMDISSTEIRYRIAEGLSIKYLVPPEVEMYIAEHNLYEG